MYQHPYWLLEVEATKHLDKAADPIKGLAVKLRAACARYPAGAHSQFDVSEIAMLCDAVLNRK